MVAQLRPIAWNLRPLDDVADVEFHWSGDLRRDRDGMRAGSKLVLDALVRAGVLLSDKASCVRGPFRDYFEVGPPGVMIRLYVGGTTYRFDFGGRLPDANEMIEAARLEGARREREQARVRWR